MEKDQQTIGRWERGETPIDPNAEAVIRLLCAERLDLAGEMTVEQLARLCVATASPQIITIDAAA